LKIILKRFYPYVKEFKLYFFFVFIGIGMSIVATTATAEIMKPMMDKMFIARDKDMLIYIPLAMIVIYILKGLGGYIQAVFTTYIGEHIVTQFRSKVMKKLVGLDMEFISSSRSGEMISRVINDIGRIQYFVSLMLPEFVRELLTVIGLIGYVLYLNAYLAFYSLIILPIVILPLVYIARKLKKLSFGSQEKNADLIARLSEIFNNIEIVKTNATEEFELKRFAKENLEFFKVNMKAVYANGLSSPILEIVGASSLAIVIFLGAKEVYAHKMSVGEFMAFLTAIGLVLQPARGLGIIYAKMQDALAASVRVFDVLDKESFIYGGNEELKYIKSISLDKVELNYGDIKALKKVSFSVKSPYKLALVGNSGGGKSSVVNLLLRLYDSSKGDILINNKNIKNFTLTSLRDAIAVVSQRVYIFQDSLAKNIAYGQSVDKQKIIDSLKQADAFEFVNALEDGIDTIMQEFGANLSGGQRQRIALARAIYKDASVLVLDEATSALDNDSEAKILKSLKKFAKDKIVISIAHRLTTIVDSDEILLFNDGEIISRGSHNYLLENSQDYKSLYQKSLDL